MSEVEKAKLEYAIRHSKEYAEWHEAVLKKNAPIYPDMPKNIQVHHIHSLKDTLKENGIHDFGEALNCKELWAVDNGVAITRGEHFILSRLERHKRASMGFLVLLEEWIKVKLEKEKK